ncbi:50S ribosomal protein L5 [Patescibacteria group bacterium]
MRLKELYNSKVIPELVKKYGYKNIMQAPKLDKVVVNVGISSKHKDSDLKEVVENTLRKISGQKPVERKAKKSISSFKIREGNIVGMSVTLRKNKMYDFVDKLVNITFPRIRDFRGISTKSFDGNGNYSIGLREQIAFPEVKPADADKLHGLEVVIVTTAKTDEEAKDLLSFLGFPFKK